MKYILSKVYLGLCVILLFSCDPEDENLVDNSHIESNANYVEGLLMNGYQGLINQYNFTCTATDDAVSNLTGDGLKNMSTGQLTAKSNPLNRWGIYKNIFYLNKFLSMVDNVKWIGKSTQESVLFVKRMKGEALALRGLLHFYILQAHAGYNESGTLMGIPYYTSFIEPDGDFNIPRLTFEETVNAIDKDFNDAYELLPYVYSDNPSDIAEKDKVYDPNLYLTVNSSVYKLRIQGEIVRGLQARLHLMAASPAFLNSKDEYKLALKYAAELCSKKNYKLASDGVEFYNEDNDKNNPEILWRGNVGESSNYESDQFPFSLNGKGRINPSQNLVDAFYKSDGYPINSSEGEEYNAQDPYSNRDPRLSKYILYNGGSIGNKVIIINQNSDNGVDKVINKSTRTGYYLKKLLRPEVVIPMSGTPTSKQHFPVYMRYTELYLIMAESLNEIGGPDYKEVGIPVSARDIIRDIRKRAMSLESDPYLESIANEDDMRKLIKNERRLELCFEGFRFWDLRRYKDNLTETIKGINNDGDRYKEIDDVETRSFSGDKYYYMPLPYSEVLKFNALQQNVGW